jgi:hypothetical protein
MPQGDKPSRGLAAGGAGAAGVAAAAADKDGYARKTKAPRRAGAL